MRMHLFFALALLGHLVSAIPAATTTTPPKGAATISSIGSDAPDVSTDGSGCRSGSVGVSFSTDYSLMTLIFDDFVAAIGSKAGTAKKRALCRVNVTIASPGWAFDVGSVDYRGYVDLDAGVDASLVSRWKWVDSKGNALEGQGHMQKKLTGPYSDDYLVHKDGETTDDQSSACSKVATTFQLTISVSLSASSSTASGIVQGDTSSGVFSEILNLLWKKC